MSTVLALIAGIATWRLLVRRPFPWRDPSCCSDVVALEAIAGDGSGRPSPPRLSTPTASLSGRFAALDPRKSIRAPSAPGSDDHASSVDLLAVTIAAGWTIPMAVQSIGESGDGATATALKRVSAAERRGSGFLDALDELERSLGSQGRDLRVPLAAAVSAGTPVGPALQRLADQHRRRRRRLVEARIRRLPVLLLLPLCGFVLPAFVVLTLVPVGLATVAELDVADLSVSGPGGPDPNVAGPLGQQPEADPTVITEDVPPVASIEPPR